LLPQVFPFSFLEPPERAAFEHGHAIVPEDFVFLKKGKTKKWVQLEISGKFVGRTI